MDVPAEGKDYQCKVTASNFKESLSESSSYLDRNADAKAAAACAEEKMGEIPMPSVTVSGILISPEEGPLCGPIQIQIEYSLDSIIHDACWSFLLSVDSAAGRHRIPLGTRAEGSIPIGTSSVLFSVDNVDVTDIDPGRLTECGLLTARLDSGNKTVIDINMVVFVRLQDGSFIRHIVSPLEG
jgi:hypothetical protein